MTTGGYTTDVFRCKKCGVMNESEPSNGACTAWFGCGFASGRYEKVSVPIQTLRSVQAKAAETEASNAAFGLLWLIHAFVVLVYKGLGYAFVSLFIGPFIWLF